MITETMKALDEERYYFKEDKLEELYKTKDPLLIGTYKDQPVYLVMFSEVEIMALEEGTYSEEEEDD